MCLHDIVAEELTDKKSLAALIYLICHGRELEFEIEGKEYFISCDKSQKYVSLWNNQNEQSFDSVDELIENALIENRAFLSIWEKEQRLNPHSYRLKGRDFVHQGKIEIDVNERAVFIRTQGCFFVYINSDCFLNSLLGIEQSRKSEGS